MTQTAFLKTAGMIFAVVGVLHVLRLLLRWDAVIGGWDVPMWVSGLAAVLAGYLAYTAFRLTK